MKMLDKEDLKAIADMISQSEARMIARIIESEERMTGKIDESESRIMQNVSVLMEAKFQPQFNILAEGQQAILETLAPKSRLEKLEDEVGVLKSVVTYHSEEIAQLKKAN